MYLKYTLCVKYFCHLKFIKNMTNIVLLFIYIMFLSQKKYFIYIYFVFEIIFFVIFCRLVLESIEY